MISFLSKAIVLAIRAYSAARNRVFLSRSITFLRKLFHYSYLKYSGIQTEFGYVRLAGLPIIKKHRNSKIIIGKNVSLISKSKENVAGINHPVILATLAEGALIKISDGCGLSGSSVCSVKSVEIGSNTGLGANAHVYDTDFHAIKTFGTKPDNILDAGSEQVTIGENVWIGTNVLILKGVTIADNAVIGAGSVVREEIPQNVIASGNPAKVIKCFRK